MGVRYVVTERFCGRIKNKTHCGTLFSGLSGLFICNHLNLNKHSFTRNCKMQDAFNPPVATRTFFDLLVSSGVPSVQLKLYENERHISPRIDLIVPTKRLCAILIEDIAECCKAATGAVMMRGCLKEDDNNQRKVDGKDNIGIKPVQEGTGIRVLG